MHRRTVLGSGLALTLGVRLAEAQPAPRSWGPANGALLIVGGGVRGAEIQEAAIRLAQRTGAPGSWVFIPTAGDDEEVARAVPPDFIHRSGASLSVLHTRDRAVADSEAFVAPLRSATGVFFEGGRQWRLVDAYAGTRTERELRGVLDRGGETAGTSAGASIQASYLVRGSPLGNEIMMAPGHERGFGYLVNAAVDQHVRARGREDDLAKVVAAHPELLGIGIDESTAVIVEHYTMTVIGDGDVFITNGAGSIGAPSLVLTRGMRYDLANWQVMS